MDKPKKKKKKFVSLVKPHIARIVLICWEDAAHHAFWQEGNDIEMLPVTCISVGMLIDDSLERISITQTLAKDNHAHRIQIPRSCITDIKILMDIPHIDVFGEEE